MPDYLVVQRAGGRDQTYAYDLDYAGVEGHYAGSRGPKTVG